MSYLRKKIAPIRATPPPGSYPQPLTIHLNCETPEVSIYYTLDGKEPVASSKRSHGFQSHTYNEISGIILKGGGSHSVTVIALRDGFVSQPVAKFKYHVQGPRAPKKQQALGDAIIERRFMAMADLDPPMPLRLARARTPDLKCALIDTMGRAELIRRSQQGEKLALFELTHNTRAVSRQDTYRRVVPPSLSVALPQLPDKQLETGLPPSLRSTPSERFAITKYEQPDFGRKDESDLSSGDEDEFPPAPANARSLLASRATTRAKTPGVQSTIPTGRQLNSTIGGLSAISHHQNNSTTRPHSRALVPMGHDLTEMKLVPEARHKGRRTSDGKKLKLGTMKGPILCKNEKGFIERYDYKPHKKSAQQATFDKQLAWFETRTGLVPKPEEEYEDVVEKDEAQQYADRVENTMSLETERFENSKMYTKAAMPGSISLGEDVAAGYKDFVQAIHAAQQICHSPLSRLLKVMPYNQLATSLGKGSMFGAADLAAASEGTFSVIEASKALNGLGVMNQDRMVDTKLFLLLLRFLVWRARPIPEAVFGLTVNFFKISSQANPGGGDARISRLEMNMVLDLYSKTRGHHADSLEELRKRTNSGPQLLRMRSKSPEARNSSGGDGEESSPLTSPTSTAAAASFLNFDDELDLKVPYTNLFHMFASKTPLIDSALVDMNNVSHPMYSQALSFHW